MKKLLDKMIEIVESQRKTRHGVKRI